HASRNQIQQTLQRLPPHPRRPPLRRPAHPGAVRFPHRRLISPLSATAPGAPQECDRFDARDFQTKYNEVQSMTLCLRAVLLFAAAFLAVAAASAQTPAQYPVTEGDYVAHNFKFKSGEELAELRLHFRTVGKPDRDAQGHVKNAILIL